MIRKAPHALGHGPSFTTVGDVGNIGEGMGIVLYGTIAVGLVIVGVIGAALIGRWGGIS